MNRQLYMAVASITFGVLFFNYKGSLNTCTNKQDSALIKSVHIIYNLPLINLDSSVVNYDNSYDVFYYKDLIMYKFFYQFDSIVNGKQMLQTKRYKYFVFQKDSLFGYNYDPYSNQAKQKNRLAIDSIKKNTFENYSYDSSFYKKTDSIYLGKEKNLLKIYNYRSSQKYPEDFTFYFFYSRKLNYIKESFSKQMDNIKNMKLYKIRIVAHGAYYEEYKMSLPQREYLLEMKEVPLQNKNEILSYFHKYKD